MPDHFGNEYPTVKVVKGNFDDVQLIADTAAEHDVVIRRFFDLGQSLHHLLKCHNNASLCIYQDNGNSKHEASLRAHIAGLLKTATSSSPRYLIRLGGTSSIADWADPTYYGETNPKIWSDVDDIDAIKSLPDTALHRGMEKIIEQAALEHNDRLRCAIICSCGVYGKGRGPGNTESGLVPMYWAQIAKLKRAFYTNSGGNTRSWVHIDDLTKVYLALVESAVQGGGRADWGREVRIASAAHLFFPRRREG